MLIHFSRLASALYFLCILFSCKPKTDYTAEIARLDSAAAKLVETEVIFNSSDTVSLRRIYSFSQEKLHAISGKIARDTLKTKAALLIADMNEQVGSLQNLLENNTFLSRAVSDGRKRLNDLKHDLQNDLIEKNKAAEYVVNEVNASAKIREAVNRAVEKAKSSAAKLDSMKTEIIHIADSLNQRKTK